MPTYSPGCSRAICLCGFAALVAPAYSSEVALVVDPRIGEPGRHGLAAMSEALRQRGDEIVEGAARSNAASRAIVGLCQGFSELESETSRAELKPPVEPESLMVHVLRSENGGILLMCGADERGLMYAALDVAEQISESTSAADPFAAVRNVVERPSVAERSVTKMLMNRAVTEQFFYSNEHWRRYLDMLAKNRYNTFTLMFGYGSAGYFDPIYPFLFSVDEFPSIRVRGLSESDQRRNREMLQVIMNMVHERGMNLNLALWTHIFEPGYNNYVATANRDGYVEGLDRDNLVPYTRRALREFLERYPGVDSIQFRVHTESSVTLPQQKEFWSGILAAVAEVRPDIRVDMRAKGFTDDLIDASLESPLEIRVTTKHWGEQTGLPYHPTEDSLANKYKRRHSYADLLTYPRRYELLYRLWSHGTNRILLWGDPEFARRFAESARLYDGAGFDVHEPLAMKMGYKLGIHEGPVYDVLSEDYQYYDWEFERYWHYYRVFGRMGYNTDAQPWVWRREFEKRFEESATAVQKAYAQASWVLPRIVAYALRDLSAGFAWAEKQRWEDLSEYIHVRPSDTAQFLGIDEAAYLESKGKRSAKIGPRRNSRWFQETAQAILANVEEAERRAGTARSKELASTLIDMRILASLAEYHSRRLLAGLNLARFELSGDLHSYDLALEREREAIAAWKEIVDLADGVYPENIIFGRSPRMDGSWKTELQALQKDLENHEERRRAFRPMTRRTVARIDFGEGAVQAGYAGVGGADRYRLLDGRPGWHHAYLLDPPELSEDVSSPEALRDFLRGPVPDEYAYSAFGMDLPNGNYDLQFTMTDRSANPAAHGPMWIEAQGRDSTDRFRIPVGATVERTLSAAVVDGRLNVVFNAATDGDFIINAMTVDRVGPVIGHTPIRRSDGRGDLTLHATVSSESEIRGVSLSYGSAEFGYRTLEARSNDGMQYRATLPEAALRGEMDYFWEATDAAGRRTRHPAGGADEPIRVRITADQQAPEVSHTRPSAAHPGEDLVLEASVSDPSGVDSVYVRYRGVSQHQDFARLRLLPAGKPNLYRATIPNEDIDPRWDFMYFLEAFDRVGNGRIYPDLNVETPYVVLETHPDRETRRSDGR